MPVQEEFSEQVELPDDASSWTFIEGLEQFFEERLTSSKLRLELRHDQGSVTGESVHEVREAIERRRARPEELVIGNDALLGDRFIALIYWETTRMRPSSVRLWSNNEAMVKGTAATLRQRIASGVIHGPEPEPVPHGNDQPASPWYRKFWPEQGVQKVVVSVVGALIVALIVAVVAWLA